MWSRISLLTTTSCKNENYLASIMDDSVILCDYRCGRNKNYSKKITCKTQNFYMLVAFLLITTVLHY